MKSRIMKITYWLYSRLDYWSHRFNRFINNDKVSFNVNVRAYPECFHKEKVLDRIGVDKHSKKKYFWRTVYPFYEFLFWIDTKLSSLSITLLHIGYKRWFLSEHIGLLLDKKNRKQYQEMMEDMEYDPPSEIEPWDFEKDLPTEEEMEKILAEFDRKVEMEKKYNVKIDMIDETFIAAKTDEYILLGSKTLDELEQLLITRRSR